MSELTAPNNGRAPTARPLFFAETAERFKADSRSLDQSAPGRSFRLYMPKWLKLQAGADVAVSDTSVAWDRDPDRQSRLANDRGLERM